MGPELIAAIVGPIVGTLLGALLWVGKRNASLIDDGFKRIGGDVEKIERRFETFQNDIHHEYMTKGEIRAHMSADEIWQKSVDTTLTSINSKLRDIENKDEDNMARISHDLNQIRENQWKFRSDLDSMRERRGLDRYEDT